MSDDLLAKMGFSSDYKSNSTSSEFVLSSLETMPAMDIEIHFGLVFGKVMVSRNPIAEFMAGLRNYFGGSHKSLINDIEQARKKAMEEMISEAKNLGANAVIGIKFENLTVAFSAIEVNVYGTAVKVVKY
jgi:uncharacterized protein YbjQ (UPF0145 family)